MSTEFVDLAFAAAALLVFRICRPAPAVLVVTLGGWLLLPVGNYPAGSAGSLFPYWITGSAVPSDMLLTKAWLAPAAAALGALLFDRRAFTALRPTPLDLPPALWCLWPVLQSSLAPGDARPAGWIATLYLLGTWGLPWLLGRLYFASAAGRRMLLEGLAVAGLACLPFSLIEGIGGPTLYGLVYELHPFRFDGFERYVGYRPIGFFENGNQFGLWVALCALAAVWLARTPASVGRRRALAYRVAAAVLVLMTLAAQSLGGILLLAAGLAFLASNRIARPRVLAGAAAAALLLGGAVYLSGIVPVSTIGKETALGRRVVDGFKAIGRGSFTWRISQDQRLLAAATVRPLTGAAAWDWWRIQGARPWGLALLVVGQFGLIGLGLLFATLLLPAGRAAWAAPRGSPWSPGASALVLATVVALSVLDGLLNSFVFFPAILIAGALAAAEPSSAG